MKKISQKSRSPLIVFLCNVRSAQNAGAIMRTADAVGANEILFGGYTPGPLDRFGRERKEFTKASLGAEKHVLWKNTRNYLHTLKQYKQAGAYIIAVEQSPRAIDYKKINIPDAPIVLVFGNEVHGLPQGVLSLADVVAEIPMRGKKESLNVSVAAGIVLFRLFDI